MQHDVRASREAAGTSSSAVKSSIQLETWLYRRQEKSKTVRACQNTLRTAEELTKENVLSTVGEQACCDARPSRIRLTHRKSESHSTVRDACWRKHRRGACKQHRLEARRCLRQSERG